MPRLLAITPSGLEAMPRLAAITPSGLETLSRPPAIALSGLNPLSLGPWMGSTKVALPVPALPVPRGRVGEHRGRGRRDVFEKLAASAGTGAVQGVATF